MRKPLIEPLSNQICNLGDADMGGSNISLERLVFVALPNELQVVTHRGLEQLLTQWFHTGRIEMRAAGNYRQIVIHGLASRLEVRVGILACTHFGFEPSVG